MQSIHNPIINLRYWILIFLASVFGTNTGDLGVRWYKQLNDFLNVAPPAFKHIGPLPFLMIVFALLLFFEEKNNKKIEFYFWSTIIVIRTAATNIADSVAGDLNINFYLLTSVLTLVLVYLSIEWQKKRPQPINTLFIPETTKTYWVMMLLAGVLGTIIGDRFADAIGLLNSALLMTILMAGIIFFGYKRLLPLTILYWFGIVFARISGTDVGDWLAKASGRGGAGLGLPLATCLTGAIFVFVVFFWPSNVSINKNQEIID